MRHVADDVRGFALAGVVIRENVLLRKFQILNTKAAVLLTRNAFDCFEKGRGLLVIKLLCPAAEISQRKAAVRYRIGNQLSRLQFPYAFIVQDFEHVHSTSPLTCSARGRNPIRSQ